MSTTRIPRLILAFNNYINNTDDYLQEVTPPGPLNNGLRLGLTAVQLTSWSGKRTQWQTTLWPAYSNVNTRTKTVNENVRSFRKSFGEFANPLINLMAASPAATQADANAFNFVLVRKKPSHSTEPILESCIVGIVPLGTGFKFTFRTDTDTKRASLAKGADCIEVLYKIGDTPPTGTKDPGLQTRLITRATYKYAVDANDSGKKLYLYVRWYNTKYPALAGGYTKLYTVVIP